MAATPSAPSSAAHPALKALLPASVASSHHPVRITSQASLNSLVSFALGHLREPAAPPLVLHSLPFAAPASTSKHPQTSTPAVSAAPAPAPAPPGEAQIKNSKKADASVAALPKLVSVVEILKREWLRVPPSPSPSSGSLSAGPAIPAEDEDASPRKGLHHYTLLTTLEALKLADGTPRPKASEEEEEQMRREEDELVMMGWLTGGAGRKKRPRRKHSPCMVVILSPTPLPSLTASKGWTYQPPDPPAAPPKQKRPAASSTATATADGAGEAGGADEGKKKKRRRRRKGGKKDGEGEKAEGMEVDAAEGGEEEE
ncbi:hypothetical protein JCM8097_000460 [Rhodosporidiobolus ruineniae]